jgi:SAM-dependent methyltransferase
MTSRDRFLANAIRCPRCGAPLNMTCKAALCVNNNCYYSTAGFPICHGQPVIIDFDDSIFDRAAYRDTNGTVLPRDTSGRALGSRLHRIINGTNPVAAANCRRFIAELKAGAERPVVLVIGGGNIGAGADELYNDPAIEVVGTDVYASEHTRLLADAHKLPFECGLFDGVWIQAVLEHVLDPGAVVAEIHRVLRPSGIAYAETPFMQQVHERAYDFTRFTLSGHRWLFRRFEEISAGPVCGPSVALLWSIRYFARALGVGDRLSRLVALPFFWIRYFDLLCNGREAVDAASGTFFLGRRSTKQIPAHAMPGYYERRSRN